MILFVSLLVFVTWSLILRDEHGPVTYILWSPVLWCHFVVSLVE